MLAVPAGYNGPRKMLKESGVTKLVERDVSRATCPEVAKRSGRSGTTPCLAVAAVLSLVVSSCSAGNMPRPAAPTDERALLDLAPDDAYFGMRVDLRAARETPHWEEISTLLAASGLKEAVPHLASTDRVWLILGGLIKAPTFESTVAPVEEPDEPVDEDAYVDESYPEDYAAEA